MKTVLTLALFAAAASSLTAQRYEPAAQKPMPKPALHEPAVKPQPASLPTEPRIDPEPVVLPSPALPVEGGAASDEPIGEDPVGDEPGLGGVTRPGSRPRPFEPVADMGIEVELFVQQDEELVLKVVAEQAGTFLGLVLAAAKDHRFAYPGLPDLLIADAIVATGIGEGSVAFAMGKVELGFPIHLQALVVNERVAGASPVVEWTTVR